VYANYSPLVRIVNAAGVIYNAPVVALDVDASQIDFPDSHVDYSKVHDEVVSIDPSAMTVIIQGIGGFSFGRQLWYISVDASIPLAAAIEPTPTRRCWRRSSPAMTTVLAGQSSASSSLPMDLL
jgi:hypothetical protein